jgi:pentatricopeptide repeat protein
MYSIAIDLFAKMGDTKGAADAFKEMRAEKIPPNFVTYTSLMEAFLNAGFSSAALSISDEMMKSPVLRKDVASYVMRIRCFVELGNLEVRLFHIICLRLSGVPLIFTHSSAEKPPSCFLSRRI